MQQLELSVILCSYNRGSTLVRCLEYFCKQTVPTERWEVVLVNDGSKDNTHELVHSREWPFQLNYIHQENTGLAGARNAGIQSARGKVLLLINDDTMAAPDLIEQHLAAHQKHPRSMILGAFEYEPWALQSGFMQAVNRSTVVFGYPDLVEGKTYDYMFSYTCNLSVSAEAYQEAGLFDTSFKSYGAEDTEMGYRLEKAGYRVVYHPKARADHAHALTLDEFIRRQINVGSNFARFFRIHPEVVRQPRWGRTCEASRFQTECMVEGQAGEIQNVVQKIRSLEADWKAANDAGRDAIAQKLVPLLQRISGYYWVAGLVKGMEREDLLSFVQLPDRRLPMIPGSFGRALASGLAISVILPTFNRLGVLKKCLAALTAQTLSPDRFEVLVCDDGSTDGTQAFLSDYSAPFRFKNLRDRNQGPGMARNRGIAQAEGKIAVIINDDTILGPNALEQHLECHLQWNDAPIAVMGAYWPSKECDATPFQNPINELFFPRTELEPNRLHDFRAFWTCNLSLALKPLRDSGGFDSRFYLAAGEDSDLGLRLAEQFGYRVLYRPDIISYHHHQHSFESFKRSCLARGRMTYHLVIKHPWLLSHWFGITEFDGRGVSQLREQVKRLGTSAPQLEQQMLAVEQLYQEAGSEATPDLAHRLALQIQPVLAKLHLFYNRQGTLMELEREHLSIDALFTADAFYKRFPMRNSLADRLVFSILIVADALQPALDATLSSLREQTLSSWEVILLDRSPTAALRPKARELVQGQTLCRYCACPGASEGEAIRQGVQVAQGFLLTVWPAGTTAENGFLAAMLNASRRFEAGLFYPDESGFAGNPDVPSDPPSRLSVVRGPIWKRFSEGVWSSDDWWAILCRRIARAGFPARRVAQAVVHCPARRFSPPKAPLQTNTEALAQLLLVSDWSDTTAMMTRREPALLKHLKRTAKAAAANNRSELAAQLNGMIRDIETAFPSDRSEERSEPQVSVVIPTFNRKEKLLRCLELLSQQTLDPTQFEVVVVDDGSTDGTEQSVLERKYPFRLQFFRQENKGPASARNFAIGKASGEIVVFLGDDIYVPAEFLGNHLRHHRLKPDEREALLGYIAWAKELEVTPFMRFITGPAGAQFAFESIQDPEKVPYLYFYTSNLSLKRAFLRREEPVFDPAYIHAAYEDTDLGYRLSKRGMRLRYRSAIVAHHDHPTDIARFCERQRRAGQMAVVFASKHPETTLAAETLQLLNRRQPVNSESETDIERQLVASCSMLEAKLDSGDTGSAGKTQTCLQQSYAKLLAMAYCRGMHSTPATTRQPDVDTQDYARTPAVSIIIPTYNRLDLTRQCLQTITAHTPKDQFEIILVDNASTDGTREFLRKAHDERRLISVLNDSNAGFARACNQGASAARAPYVLFLNNDTEVKPGWFEALLKVVQADPAVSAVGSRLLYGDGTVQHAGIGIFDDQVHRDPLQARNLGQRLPADAPEVMKVREFQALTAACLLVRKTAFDGVNGFDEGYWNGYEDVDLCFKLRAAGGRIVYQPESVVVHHESQSGTERFAKAQENISRLHGKWRGQVQPDFIIHPDGSATKSEFARIVTYAQPQANMPLHEAGLAAGKPAPVASIIVLAMNQLDHTRRCIDSLFACTGAPFEIILVDNGSTDGTGDYFAGLRSRQERIKVISNRANLGFAAGNNQGLSAAAGDVVVLLNNDTIVTEGWLENMLNVLEQHPDTGVVGPVSNNVSGPQLVKDPGYKELTELPAFAAKWSETNRGRSFEVGRAVGFCLMARRSVIEAIGGLDERFGSGNFEDDDFCIRAQLAGFRIRIAQDSFVHHTGSQTFKGARIDYRQAMLRNWELFRRKWQFPADVVLEKGYPVPKALPSGVDLKVMIPDLKLSHEQSNPRCWIQRPTKATQIQFEIPQVARLGILDAAKASEGRREFQVAAQQALAAIDARPFHPEAWLLLAESAAAAGDGSLARDCAKRARDLAPGWKTAKQFLQKPRASLRNSQSPIANSQGNGQGNGEWTEIRSRLTADSSPRLTVCVITKNEETFIAQCLKSIKPIAQQIVVLDTGSTDRTVEIAKELGAEVHAFAWCDDFSAARNAALEHARGDWVLMLDADEELPANQHENLMKDLRDSKAIAFRVPLVNQGSNDGRSFVPRLFRNAPGVYYRGRIHEQVFPSLLPLCKAWGLETRLGSAQLLHHGYTKELLKDRNKIERNLKLLKQAIEEQPNDVNLVMNLGLELVRSGSFDEGLRKYSEAFAMMSAQAPATVVPELREVLLTQYTCHLCKARRFDEVRRVLNSQLASRPGLTASLHYALGLACYESKQYGEAAEQMRHCISKRNTPALSPINTDILTAAPQHCLALSLSQLDRIDEAEKAFQAAMAEQGRTEEAKLDYAKFLANHDRQVDALHQLHELISRNASCAAAWRIGGEISLKHPQLLEFACDWTGEAMRHLSDDPVIIAQRAEALLLSQQVATAKPLWEKVCNGARPPRALAAVILCSAVESDSVPGTRSGDEELAASRAFVEWYQRLISAGAKDTIVRLNSRVNSLRNSLPTAASLLDSALAEANKPANG